MIQTERSPEARKETVIRACSVDALITSQAASKPNAAAVVWGQKTLTYAELEASADELARRLNILGVGPEAVVAICVSRSPAFIVAALAVLKAGGAYLPLDPSYPSARLAFILQDAGVKVLLTGESPVNLPFGPWVTLALDDMGGMAEYSTLSEWTPTARPSNPQNLAYVIYTSGSTGQPKGVEVTHASLLNLIQWHQHAFKITSGDRATQLARLGFDAAVWEIWPYLTIGASLHLPVKEQLNDPAALRDWLVAQRITVSFAPTPTAEQLLELTWPKETQLRVLLTGADVLHRHPPADLPFFLVNNYGPTECTVVATSGLVPSGAQADRLPSIGLPIANTQVYVLDAAKSPVPIGTPGELYIGGISLAKGYRNRPDLTAEKFIPNPFSKIAGERLYRTGDLVKRLADGQLAFLGRIDEQIKVRGFRIEPDEIAAALDEHPGVRQSVVMAREITPGERGLVAYLVPAVEAPTSADLRDFLSGRLPDYMIPATFVLLENLPLTPNGKVDRAALPAPDDNNTLRNKTFTGPRSDTETTLATMLAPLLGLKEIDVEDNFFTVGGHSLLGTQLIARARDVFQVEIPLRLIFEAPTVAQLAAEIERLLLAKLENMSEEEAQSLLHQTQNLAKEEM